MRLTQVKTVGSGMIFGDEVVQIHLGILSLVVQNIFGDTLTCFGIFLFFLAYLSFCPVNKNACYFLNPHSIFAIFLLFFLPECFRLQARSVTPANFL